LRMNDLCHADAKKVRNFLPLLEPGVGFFSAQV
jgi:hypothetical protein